MDRFPDEKVVSEGKKKYVVYECRGCHHKDIERLATGRSIALWEDKTFHKYDDSYIDENEGH
jgi:hypothetical protein